MLWQMPQQRSQMLKRKFADWQNLLRLAASHALTLEFSPLCVKGNLKPWARPKKINMRRNPSMRI
jgi:hypothetical protein